MTESKTPVSLWSKLKGRVFPWRWAILGLLSILLSKILSYAPTFTESIYRNGLFKVIRWIKDSLFNWVPFPLAILFFVWIIYLHYLGWRKRTLFGFTPWYRGIANFLGIVIFFFYVSWGFNYSAPGIADKLEYNYEETLRTDQLVSVAKRNALEIRAKLDSSSLFTSEISDRQLNAIHSSVREYLRNSGVDTPGDVRMRRVSKSGWLRRIGISGIYFPFAAEAHTDASYLALSQWFTLAHEYAHGYGITDEGECNFIAFASLLDSGVYEFEYCAWYTLWMYLEPFDESDTSIRRTVLHQDRIQLRRHREQFTAFAPGVAEASNNLYLKSQGIEEGIQSYLRWTLLAQQHLATKFGSIDQAE